MKNTLTIVLSAALALVMLVCIVGMQSTRQDEIAQLRQQIADIGLRVSRLEQASGVTPGAVAGSSTSASDNVPRSMVVAGVSTFDNAGANQDDIDKLQNDAEAMQNTAQHHMDQQARVAGDTYYVNGYYSDGHYGYNHSNAGRERQEISQREMAERYATQASIKRQQAEALENAANAPHQIITGHDGNVTFTLRTKRSLAEELSKINIGDTVTWTGTRVSGDETSETWEISTIRKVEMN